MRLRRSPEGRSANADASEPRLSETHRWSETTARVPQETCDQRPEGSVAFGAHVLLTCMLRISCVASLIDFRVATQGTPADCGHPFQRNAGEELADRPVNLNDSECLCICSTRCPARNILRPRVPWAYPRPDSKKTQSVTVHRESSGIAGRCCDLTDSSFVSYDEQIGTQQPEEMRKCMKP